MSRFRNGKISSFHYNAFQNSKNKANNFPKTKVSPQLGNLG